MRFCLLAGFLSTTPSDTPAARHCAFTVRQLDLVSKLALAQITQLAAPMTIACLEEDQANLKRQLKKLRMKLAEDAEDEDESKIEKKRALAGKKKGAPLTPWASGKKQRKK